MCDEKQKVVVTTKVCKCCGRELPITEFTGHNMSKDGHMNVCKACKAKIKANKYKGDSELSKFTPRELIKELHARGYVGKLIFIERHEIDLSDF